MFNGVGGPRGSVFCSDPEGREGASRSCEPKLQIEIYRNVLANDGNIKGTEG